MNIKLIILKILNYLENNKILTAIKNGMIYAIPFFIFGAFGLVIQYFPIEGYSLWLKDVFDGKILYILNAINYTTMGIVSPLLVITISYSYSRLVKYNNSGHLTFCITSFMAFMAVIHIDGKDFNLKDLNVSGVFTAIVTTILACILYEKIFGLLSKMKSRHRPYLGDLNFNNAIFSIYPIILTVMIIIILRSIMYWCGITSINASTLKILENMFGQGSRSFYNGLLYVSMTTLLWFFGIHGSDVFENIALTHFTEINGSIFSKTFVDTFVLMGGCGTAICLVIAILLLSKTSITRKNTRMSVLPALFNVSEPLIFGIPVVFNPILFIPFIITPALCYITSYAATYFGFVPVVHEQVNWTTPIFVSGFAATDSISGSLLQLINLCLGILIYGYFIKLNDKIQIIRYKDAITEMQLQLNEDIEKGSQTNFIDGKYSRYGARLLTDIYDNFQNGRLVMYYQPQVSSDNICYGAEALLRYQSSECGFVPPPLLLQIAHEGGFLYKIEENIAEQVFKFVSTLNKDLLISFNVTAQFISRSEFIDIIDSLHDKYNVDSKNIAIEITEEMAFSSPKIVLRNVQKLHERGYSVILDDFGMGHSSLMYINDYSFDNVKITGDIVIDAVKSQSSRQIISSIVQLGNKSGFTVTAEYVEDEHMQKLLCNLGCKNFQGYYYSKAISEDDFKIWIEGFNNM